MELTPLSAYEQTVEQLKQKGHYACFEYQDASVGFYSDEPEAASILSKRFAGYFSTTDNNNVNLLVYMSQDTALFQQLYSKIEAEISADKEYTELPLDATRTLIFDRDLRRTLRTEKICYILDQEKRTLLISYCGEEKNRRALAQRVIRTLIRFQMFESGWVQLVGASFERDGIGVCIIGDKQSGKTSTLINQLSSPETNLVASNRIFVRDAGNSLEICGFPHAASIRVGTVLTHPELQRWLDQPEESHYEQVSADQVRKISNTTPLKELKNQPEKITLMPEELVELFDTSIVNTAPLKAFLVVKFDPELDEARMELLEGFDGIIAVAEHYRTIFFERQRFLRTFFTLTDEVLVERLFTILTNYQSIVSVQSLTQSTYTNAQVETLIRGLIRDIQGEKLSV